MQNNGLIPENRTFTEADLKYVLHRMFTTPSTANSNLPAIAPDSNVNDYQAALVAGGQAIVDICGSLCQSKKITYTDTVHYVSPNGNDYVILGLRNVELLNATVFTRKVDIKTGEISAVKHAITSASMRIDGNGKIIGFDKLLVSDPLRRPRTDRPITRIKSVRIPIAIYRGQMVIEDRNSGHRIIKLGLHQLTDFCYS